MTHCVACDRLLSDFESTRKADLGNGKYYYPDLCNKCFKTSDLGEYVPILERSDLATEDDVSTEFDDVDETNWQEQNWVEEDEE
jgi:hypothetical protein